MWPSGPGLEFWWNQLPGTSPCSKPSGKKIAVLAELVISTPCHKILGARTSIKNFSQQQGLGKQPNRNLVHNLLF